MPSLGSKGCVLWGSQTEAGLVSSNQKNQSFGKLLGVEYLTKAFTRVKAWESGKSAYNEVCQRESYQELVTLGAVFRAQTCTHQRG